MKKAIFCGILITLLHLVGCSKNDAERPATPVEISNKIIKEHSEDLKLEGLLAKSREELAAECAELETSIRRQAQLRQQGELDARLLPEERFPLMPPVFREAAYNAAVGFSLPPYLKDGQIDSAVALHLARHGDVEAALKLVAAHDAATRQKIEALKLDRNYPVEWTRLVGLTQHHLAFTTATDSPEATRQLMALHCQLRALLSAPARESPLGHALLPRGLDVLKRCGPKSSDAKLGGDIEEFFKISPLAQTTEPSLPRSRAELEQLFGTRDGTAAVLAQSPLRVFDLSGLDLPHDSADRCVAFPHTADGKMEWLLTYRPGGLHEYAKPEQFAVQLEKRRPGKSDGATAPFQRRQYLCEGGELEVILTPQHHALSALVRLTAAPLDAKTPDAALPRAFGNVSLERSFEANRRLFAWKEQGKTLTVRDPKLRAGVHDPVTSRSLFQATLEKSSLADLLDYARFEYADTGDSEHFGVIDTALPLFAKFGFPRLNLVESGGIDFAWSDAATTYVLRFPGERAKRVTLDVRDAGATPIDQRLQGAQKAADAERKARIQNDKALSLVPRHLDQMRLGMSQADFSKLLPRSPDLVQRDIPGGVMASFTGVPRGVGEVLAREWFARFDDADRLVELRVRYTDHPGASAGTVVKKKIDAYKTALGKPHTSTLSPNPAHGWSAKKFTPHNYLWHDDLTLLQCHHDAGGVEVVLRDCPLAHPEGAPVARLEYLPLGVGPIKLGAPLETIQKLQPKAHEDALLIESKSKETFDAYLVWIKNDRVVRVAARHRIAAPMKTPADATQQISEAWSRAKEKVGYPRLFTTDPATRHITGWGTFDDVTRFRVHLLDDGRTAQLFSEWSLNDAGEPSVQVTER